MAMRLPNLPKNVSGKCRKEFGPVGQGASAASEAFGRACVDGMKPVTRYCLNASVADAACGFGAHLARAARSSKPCQASAPTTKKWGESLREGKIGENSLLSPALSSSEEARESECRSQIA